MDSISIFEIIKIGIGPSSSHTVGPWRAASFFLAYLKKVNQLQNLTEITTYLYGSLAKTGTGHGTDIAIMMGLSGENFLTIDTNDIEKKINHINKEGLLHIKDGHSIPFEYEKNIVFEKDKSLTAHPNGMEFIAQFKDGSTFSRKYYSTGGGFIDTDQQDNPDQVKVKSIYPCHSESDISKYCTQLNLQISELVLLNEKAWRTEEATKKQAQLIWDEMKDCIFRGVQKSGTLPGGLNVRRRAYDLNKKMMCGQKFSTMAEWIDCIKNGPKDFNVVNKWVSIFALAVNEENASFGRIVTAPTNGASGVLPSVLMYAHCFIPHFNEEEILKFILTAGEIGTLYKKKATISAAMGGCQAEIGVSSSMAAAGLTEALGGSKEQVFQAAEIAMEHHLGMTCDPIGGLVQVPCIERNSMGAIKAITASNLALESDSSAARLSLDDVIHAMWETALDMNSKYKETSQGGLAKIPVNIVEC